MDQPPPELKQFGWITRGEYHKFKEAGVRAWTNPSYLSIPSKHPILVWVEQHIIDLADMYNRECFKGNKWAGLSEVEFILAAASR